MVEVLDLERQHQEEEVLVVDVLEQVVLQAARLQNAEVAHAVQLDHLALRMAELHGARANNDEQKQSILNNLCGNRFTNNSNSDIHCSCV